MRGLPIIIILKKKDGACSYMWLSHIAFLIRVQYTEVLVSSAVLLMKGVQSLLDLSTTNTALVR